MTAFCSTCYLLRGGDNCGRLMPLREVAGRPELPGHEAMEL